MSEVENAADHDSASDARIDRGLAEAFGAQAGPHPPASVLQALQSRTGARLDLHLDAAEPDDAPVRVTEEVRKLRDPSGRYQVLGEIGRGGVGVVYKGRDTDLGRDVAMKVLKDEYATRPDVLARFVEEAQIGGQLQHPGIVPVYELGLQAGERPYFAMKLVKGETLAEQLGRRESPADERRRLLGVFEQVCQTVAYAHARRVVHRDLKPANVMIGAFGEVQVVDWGFAKVLPKGGSDDEAQSVARASARSVIETVRSRAESGSHSLPGSMLGTPAYMPPEQASGDVRHVDRRSDVFALGAILCEILTGEPPYREQDGDLVRQAANAELDGALERLRRCGADAALVALCTECLAPAKRARPESGVEVAERVGAYLTSVEERARRAEVDAAEARYRHRTTLLAAAAGLAVVLLGAGAWIWIDGQAQQHRAEATQRVASAMSIASGARGRAAAESDGLDPTLWDAALHSTRQATELASSDDVDAPTRATAEALLAEVERERAAAAAEAARRERDQRMLARLEELRVPVDDDERDQHWKVRESRRLDEEYARGFADYLRGASLFEQPLELTLESIGAGDIEQTLALALDHWALVRDRLRGSTAPPDAGRTARLRELAARLDSGDAQRAALRHLLPRAAEEGPRLLALADGADLASLSADGCRVLGEALCHAGLETAVVAVLQRAQEMDPQDFGICIDLAVHLEMLDEPGWEEALTAYRIAHALKPGRTAVLHRQGVALERIGRAVEAERIHRRVLELDPENPHVLCHLGWSLAAQSRSREALEAFERALEIDPDWADAHKMIGAELLARGAVDEGIEHYRRAVATSPRNAVHHYNLGTVLMNAGDLDEAIDRLREAIRIQPRYTAAHGNLGWALAERGYLEESRKAFLAALELDPEQARVLFNLGNTYRRMGLARDAVDCYERSLAIAPHQDNVLVNLGNVLASLGEVEPALDCFRRALEIEPDDALTIHNLAVTLEDAGRLDEAAEAFRRTLEVDPDYGPSQRRLARIEQRDALREVLAGREVARSSEQWANAILIGYQEKRFAEVVALTEATLALDGDLVGDESWHLYNSACAAALLAADAAAEPSEAERSRVRELARTWLSSEVERWNSWLAEGSGRAASARDRLTHALRDPKLDSVRGEALGEVPAAERADWEELWSAIERAAGTAGR